MSEEVSGEQDRHRDRLIAGVGDRRTGGDRVERDMLFGRDPAELEHDLRNAGVGRQRPREQQRLRDSVLLDRRCSLWSSCASCRLRARDRRVEALRLRLLRHHEREPGRRPRAAGTSRRGSATSLTGESSVTRALTRRSRGAMTVALTENWKTVSEPIDGLRARDEADAREPRDEVEAAHHACDRGLRVGVPADRERARRGRRRGRRPEPESWSRRACRRGCRRAVAAVRPPAASRAWRRRRQSSTGDSGARRPPASPSRASRGTDPRRAGVDSRPTTRRLPRPGSDRRCTAARRGRRDLRLQVRRACSACSSTDELDDQTMKASPATSRTPTTAQPIRRFRGPDRARPLRGLSSAGRPAGG